MQKLALLLALAVVGVVPAVVVPRAHAQDATTSSADDPASGPLTAEPSADLPAESDPSEADSSDATKSQEATFEERLDALLAEAPVEDFGETQRCLFRRQYTDIDILNENMLLFSSNKQYWLNTLKRTCHGIRRDMVINIVLRGVSSLCANDQVYANRRFDLDQGIMHSGRPAVVRATCALGEYQLIDPTFAESLKALR